MRWPSIAFAAIVAVLAATVPLHARTLCTIVVDAHDGVTLVREGACEDRVTPASTFKFALAVMGFDGGFLEDATTPTLPFREGYPDWLGDIWRRDTNPTTWLEYSVVWYSQQIAKALGRARLEAYARGFSYGNGDFSGDAGKDNGLERAWISSSLKISPVEQTAFLRRLVTDGLPVAAKAMAMTRSITQKTALEAGWVVHGKTGSAYPRRPDGSFDRNRGWGWFVGWAERHGRLMVFARLAQADGAGEKSGGRHVRTGFLRDFPAIVASLPD